MGLQGARSSSSFKVWLDEVSIETNTGNSHTVMMLFRHLLAVAILPFSVTVLVPVWIGIRYSIGFALGTSVFPMTLQTVGVVVITLGLLLFITSLRRFATEGKGTLAPWDPSKRLVVRGPYRFVRNPMISGIILILAGEAMLLVSKPHAIWALIFLGINMIYIPLFEEPSLRQRFGEDYVEYCKHVPRIFPRLRPWSPNVVDKNMRVMFPLFVFFSFPPSIQAQQLPVWERVHTFEEKCNRP